MELVKIILKQYIQQTWYSYKSTKPNLVFKFINYIGYYLWDNLSSFV